MKNLNIKKTEIIFLMLFLPVGTIFSMEKIKEENIVTKTQVSRKKTRYIIHRTMVLVDFGLGENKFGRHSGALGINAWQNLKQKAAPMIVSGVILDLMFSYAKNFEKYIQEKNKKELKFNLENSLKKSYRMGLVGYKIIGGYLYGKELDNLLENWVIYKHKSTHLFKIIPKKYIKKIKKKLDKLTKDQKLLSIILLGNVCQWYQIRSQKDLKFELKKISIKNKMELYTLYFWTGLGCFTKLHCFCPKVDLEAIKSAFVSRKDLKGALTVYHNIFFSGHGNYSRKNFKESDLKLSRKNKHCTDPWTRFANMTFGQTKNWLRFMHNNIDTLSCMFTSCFAGGYHTWKVHRIINNIYKKNKDLRKPIIIIGGLTDSLTYSSFGIKDNSSGCNFANYFDKMEHLFSSFIEKKQDFTHWLKRKNDELKKATREVNNQKRTTYDGNGIAGIPVLCAPCKRPRILCKENEVLVINETNANQTHNVVHKRAVVFEVPVFDGTLHIKCNWEKAGGSISPTFVSRLFGDQVISIRKMDVDDSLERFLRDSLFQLKSPYPILFKIKTAKFKDLSTLENKDITFESIVLYKHCEIGTIFGEFKKMIGVIIYKSKEKYYHGLWNDAYSYKDSYVSAGIGALKEISKKETLEKIKVLEKLAKN
ncbi:hypothetical protein ACFLYU_02185 [Candidatus Dependentiae bacterium]